MLEKLPEAIGEALSEQRAGLTSTVFHAVDLRQGMAAMRLSSLAFADHAPLPAKYTADGAGLSPPLHWADVPALAAELVLIVEDADSPTPQPFVHAIVHGLAVASGGTGALPEAAFSVVGDSEPMVATGRNSLFMARWLPPDPPPGHGVHRYVFQLFALAPATVGDSEANPLPQTPGREALTRAIAERGLASACLIGTYERPSTRLTEGMEASVGADAAGSAALAPAV